MTRAFVTYRKDIIEKSNLAPFHNPNFLLRQLIQLIHHLVNFFVGGFDLMFYIKCFLAFLIEVFFPFGFFGKSEFDFIFFNFFQEFIVFQMIPVFKFG